MFSASCKYAIRAVLFLALNTDENHKIGVSTLSVELGIPQHFLAKILQRLTKSKLVSSSKGKNGGFFLSEREKQQNLLAIMREIDGPDILETCVLGLDQCSSVNPCPYHESVLKFRTEFYNNLLSETIMDVAERINRDNLSLKN